MTTENPRMAEKEWLSCRYKLAPKGLLKRHIFTWMIIIFVGAVGLFFHVMGNDLPFWVYLFALPSILWIPAETLYALARAPILAECQVTHGLLVLRRIGKKSVFYVSPRKLVEETETSLLIYSTRLRNWRVYFDSRSACQKTYAELLSQSSSKQWK